MKTTFKRTVSMVLVTIVLFGTYAFADTNPQGSIETVTIEACTAKEVVGEYPANISEKHRSQLDGLLGRIDMYNAAGDYATVNKLWKMVDEILSVYHKPTSNSQSQGGDYMSFDDFIKNYAPNLTQNEQNILQGYYQNVILAYQSKDQQQIQQADQAFFAVLDGMVNQKINSIKPDYVSGSKSAEDDWEAPVAQDPDTGDEFDLVINNLPQDVDPIVRQHVIELIDEIRHFESVGNFSFADHLRNELTDVLDVIESLNDPDFIPDFDPDVDPDLF